MSTRTRPDPPGTDGPSPSTWRQLWTLVATDLRQKVRDKSVFVFALGVPLAMITVFNLVFGGAEEVELRPVEAVVSVPADDDLALVVRDALTQAAAGGLDLTVTQAEAGEVERLVEDGEAAVGLVVPEGFGADLRAGRGPAVRALQGDDLVVESQIVLSIVDGVLDQLAATAEAAAAAAQGGVPPEDLEGVARAVVAERPAYRLVEGETSPQQLGSAAALVAGQTGLFLFFTVGFGVLGLVIERENGTLARLRSMPMPPGLVVASKAMVSFFLGVVATSLLLGVGSLLFDVGFGSLPAVAVLVVAAAAAATSLTFVIARVARTSEQAQVAQSIVAMLLGVAGGAFFPLRASGVAGTLLELNPVAALIRGLGVTAGGGGLTDIGVPLLSLLGFAVAMVVAARLLPDRGGLS